MGSLIHLSNYLPDFKLDPGLSSLSEIERITKQIMATSEAEVINLVTEFRHQGPRELKDDEKIHIAIVSGVIPKFDLEKDKVVFGIIEKISIQWTGYGFQVFVKR